VAWWKGTSLPQRDAGFKVSTIWGSGPLPIAAVSDTEQRLQNTLREVSEQNGATFLDAQPMSEGHDMCSPDRWWVNLVDPVPPAPGNLPLHLNAHGTAAYGQFIGHALQ
ncbi:hypothetical protein ABRP75_10720, partial [Corynebacterium sp. KPL4043]